MSTSLERAIAALDRRFLLDHPKSAARRLEQIPRDEAAAVLSDQPPTITAPVVTAMAPDIARLLFDRMPEQTRLAMLAEMAPNAAARILTLYDQKHRDGLLGRLDSSVAASISASLSFPANSAGALMDTQVTHFRASATVAETLDRLRATRARSSRSIFVIGDDNRLAGRVTLQDLALSTPDTVLRDIVIPVSAVVSGVASRDEVVDLLERHRLVDLAVIDAEGQLLGIVLHDALLQAIQEDASADIQTMVGASKEEKALSPALFAVRKRLPWLQINLLTAFLAAAVVGIFEQTIAMFTALAVLLPVVAGQSGNAGAQALAVTMRGLALREIGLRHWLKVTVKEVQTGFVNGIAVALTCGIGVYFWSGSVGLVLVIATSMILAMIAAGFAGAVVPIVLTRLGQDPAQSSSIILTTVTDIAGFFSFLGIATLLAGII